MAIIGSIIKGLINFRDVVSSDINPVEAQHNELKHLLKKAKHTAFGEYYNFDAILKNEDPEKAFADKVPFFNYNMINDRWWQRIHEGEDNITWPGSTPYFARSSGTTGTSTKLIPVTEDMIESIRQTGIKQVGSLANYDLPSDFFEKEIMMLGSSTHLEEKSNHKEGEISGISASNIPTWFRGFYKPGTEIAEIEDWDQRVLQIAKKAREWDIGAISGIPAWTELILKKIIEYHGVKNIHEIWPDFMVYTSGGVAFETYEKSFNELLGKPVTVIDTYLATEGFLAFQQRPQTDSMKLVLDNGIYFEFVPFKDEFINDDGSVKPEAPVVPLSEIEEEKDYVLLVSTVSGLWRYVLGDTIKFTDKKRMEIK
ncbi:MAG TPA: GH3 auxin-responsive promoter family protein, partial [Salinimicrobium sp.]|nr:GH3 auxin-responsive promoter family protein [Salinimicrobium sp.]